MKVRPGGITFICSVKTCNCVTFDQETISHWPLYLLLCFYFMAEELCDFNKGSLYSMILNHNLSNITSDRQFSYNSLFVRLSLECEWLTIDGCVRRRRSSKDFSCFELTEKYLDCYQLTSALTDIFSLLQLGSHVSTWGNYFY